MSCWAWAYCWTRASGKCLRKTARTRMHHCSCTRRCGLESFSGNINNQTVNWQWRVWFGLFSWIQKPKHDSTFRGTSSQGWTNTFWIQGLNILHLLYIHPKKEFVNVLRTGWNITWDRKTRCWRTFTLTLILQNQKPASSTPWRHTMLLITRRLEARGGMLVASRGWTSHAQDGSIHQGCRAG